MMTGYFHRVAGLTPTRFWINNPTPQEADVAIAAGATGCTCNPSYCQKMIDHPAGDRGSLELLDQAVKESDNDSEAQAILQRKLAKPILDRFRPLYEINPGRDGMVSLQGDPIREHDPSVIFGEGLANRALSDNVCVKVPVTAPGLKAIEALIQEGVPVNATEIFAVSQAITLCDLYDKVTRRSGKSPTIFLSHIAGIYDDYLKACVEKNNMAVSSDVLWQAGLAVARKVYRVIKERGSKAIFIGGGARGLHHFTEMVGGDLVVTINWLGTADKLIESDPPVIHRLFNPVPPQVIEELVDKLPDFRRGYMEDGLSVEEYETFGPVELFRSHFVRSWERVLSLAAERRAALTKSF